MSSKKIIGRTLLIVALSIVSAGAGYFLYLSSAIAAPLDPGGSSSEFVVAKGSGFRQLARQLQDGGIISSARDFSIYLIVSGKYKHLKEGTYVLSPRMSPRLVAQYLATGKTKEYRVTIIEGWRLTDIAKELEKKEIVPAQEFLAAADGLEGYLFPDTYQFEAKVTASEIVQKMQENFNSRTNGMIIEKGDIILASIVEREAKHDEDRAKIASVYKNRLEKDMFLEADPTVQYAKGSWDKITTDDYRSVVSPYNTYLNKGLPPGPICNPGLKSIEAALNPAKTDYLYFFSLDDGTTIYSKTKEEHEQQKQEHGLNGG